MLEINYTLFQQINSNLSAFILLLEPLAYIFKLQINLIKIGEFLALRFQYCLKLITSFKHKN